MPPYWRGGELMSYSWRVLQRGFGSQPAAHRCEFGTLPTYLWNGPVSRWPKGGAPLLAIRDSYQTALRRTALSRRAEAPKIQQGQALC